MQQAEAPAVRFHGLDAVRAFALLLGIFLHASVAYWPDSGAWAIHDRSTSAAAFALGFHYIHMFRLAAFFLMAGFFGRLLYHRRGPAGFVTDRLKRVLLPLVCGWLVLYPLIVLVWLWGIVAAGKAISPEAAGLPLWQIWTGAFLTGAVFRDGIAPAHLWFLYCLLQMYLAVLLARPLLSPLRAAADRLARIVFGHAAGPSLLAIPVALTLYLSRSPAGVPTPDRNLRPDPLVLLAYGSFFAAGWLLHRQTGLLQAIARRAPAYLVAGFALGSATLAFVARMPIGTPLIPAPSAATFAAAYALGMVFLTLGFTGAFLRWFSRPVPAIRYLSDSAYWLYLAHLPLVCALQVALSHWRLHWSLKLTLILAISIPLLLLSYQYLVRYTPIGRILNGPRTRGQLRQREVSESMPATVPE